MRKHELDLVSLVAGVLFIAIAAAYLVAGNADLTVSARWLLPLALIGIGLAGLASPLRHRRR